MNYCPQDSENDHIYHSELFTLTKRMPRGEPQKLSFTVPIFEPHPPQYYIRAVSDSWLHAEAFYTITFHNLLLPEVFDFVLIILWIKKLISSCFLSSLWSRMPFLLTLKWTIVVEFILKATNFSRHVLHILNF